MLRRGCVPGANRGERRQAPWLTRRWRRVVIAAVVLLLVLTGVPATAAAVLLENPDALQALSARVLLPPQPGAHPWDGRSRLVVALFGLTQRTTEPART